MNIFSVYCSSINSPQKVTTPKSQGVSLPLLPPPKQDEFVLTSKNEVSISFEKEVSQKKEALNEKLVKLYKEKQFEEITDIPSVLERIKTPEETDFLENYVKTSKFRVTHTVLKNISKEFENFRKKNDRAMNSEEMKIFNEYMCGLEYRSKNKEMNYEGNIFHELVLLGKNPEAKKDIIKLVENKFIFSEGYDYEEGEYYEEDYFPRVLGKDIGRLLAYKQRNPEIAHLIIPFASKFTESGQTYSAVKDFFEFYKKEKMPAEIVTLSHNPNFDQKQIESFYQRFIKDNNFAGKIAAPKLDKYPYQFMERVLTTVQKYPELAEQLSPCFEIPEYFINVMCSSEKKENSAENLRVKSLTENNPLIEKINKILHDDDYIDWKALIPDGCTKEKANQIIQIIHDALSGTQRLDSRKDFSYDSWSIKNKILIDSTVPKIQERPDFKTILYEIGKDYGSIFGENNDEKRGEKRTASFLYTTFDETNYSEYLGKFNKLIGTYREAPFIGTRLTQIKKNNDNTSTMEHPYIDFVDKTLHYAEESYNNVMDYLYQKRSGKIFDEKELKDIDDNMAQMYYLIANTLPFNRGTAGVSNILMRSMYKALGIKIPATKHNVGLDLEAFYMPMDEYKQNWRNFFEKE